MDKLHEGISRRSFLQAGAIAGTGAAFGAVSSAGAQNAAPQNDVSLDSGVHDARDLDIASSSIARLQRMMGEGRLSSK